MSTRIALLWPQTSSLWTAGSIYFTNLLESLRLAGHADDVVIVEPHGGCFTADGGSGVPVVGYEPTSRAGLKGRALDFARRRTGVGDPLAAALKRSGADVAFGYADIRRMPVPWVGWLTDFQQMHLPEFFPEQYRAELDGTFAYVAEHAPVVMLSSEDARKDFERFSPSNAHKGRSVPFVSLFSDDDLAGDPAEVAARYHISSPFVVVSNQWFRHKNHETAIRAAAVLRDRGVACDWVMTGVLADYRDPSYVSRMLQLIAELDLSGVISVLGVLPRREQLQLMRGAATIVQPSRFEGWSTLVEDAKTLGQRIVVSDIGVHREQEPPSALFFDPLSSDDLAEKVTEMLEGAVERVPEDEARAASLERAKAFGEKFYAACEEAAATRA